MPLGKAIFEVHFNVNTMKDTNLRSGGSTNGAGAKIPFVEILLRVIFLISLVGMALLLFALPAFSQNTIYLGDDPANPESCTCLNNAGNLTNGQFHELITVESPAGQTWTVFSVSGLYGVGSPAPPAAPVAITPGSIMPEVAPGKYQMPALHVDGEGFALGVTNGLGEMLSIANTCYYPNPSITGLPAELCLTSLPVTLQADVGDADGTGFFTINGLPATVFDPIALGPGNYLVEYTFDAGEASANDPSDPGCVTTVQKVVVVHPAPDIAVNDVINLFLGPSCSSLIIPDMVLEGSYPCIDSDYIITVFDPSGNPIGNVVTGAYAGQTLPVLVTTQAGGYSGVGSIAVFDPIAPTLTCPGPTNMATAGQDVQLLSGQLEDSGPSFIPSDFNCFQGPVTPGGGVHFYRLHSFSVTESDIYTFELNAEFGFGAGAVYHGAYTAAGGPCTNLMTLSRTVDPGDGYFTTQNDIVRITVPLKEDETYTLLSTSRTPLQTGAYQWAVYSLGEGEIEGVAAISGGVVLDLFCTDADSLYNNPAAQGLTGSPLVNDNCANANLTFTDVLTRNGDCGNDVITRSFKATDQSGNTGNCSQQITIHKPKLKDVWLPPKTYNMTCEAPFATTGDGNPHPSASGYPFVVTAFGAFNIAPAYCNILATYTDQARVQVCDGSYQFIRRWFLLDDCDPTSNMNYDQLIRVSDQTGPQVICPGTDTTTLVFPTTPSGCSATFEAPLPEVTDNCSGWEILTEIVTDEYVPITNPVGQVIGQDTQAFVLVTIPAGATSRLVSGIPLGCHRFRYTVTDGCNNVTVVECDFCIEDLRKPTAVCDDNLIVSLGGGGSGTLFAVDVDEGSSDNCGVADLEVRRIVNRDPATCQPVSPFQTPWGEFVQFNCCDVNTTAPVELKVTDLYGNENTCTTHVLVKDNSAPNCVAPASVNINCGSLPPGFDTGNTGQLASLFGTAQAIDDCLGATILELAPLVNINNCGAGTITRRFKAIDQSGNNSTNTCQQVITISSNYNYLIKFPKDVQGVCGLPEIDSLAVSSMGCESFAISVSDQYFDDTGAACYKIFRTYHVIDWCEYNGVAGPVEIGRDEDCDGAAGDENVWLVRLPNGAYIDRDGDAGNNVPPASTKNTTCDGTTNPAGYWRTTPSTGYWKYTQVIKVIDNTPPIINYTQPEPFCAISNTNCEAIVAFPFTVSDACMPPAQSGFNTSMSVRVFFDAGANGVNDEEITGNALFGNFPNYTISRKFPIGNHAFEVVVNDGCGNVATRKLPFEVVDCSIPSFTCIVGLSYQISPNGTVVVNATDFVNQPVEADCSPPLTWSINRVGENPDIGQQSIVMTCDDFGAVLVEIHLWDHAFNPNAVQPDGSLGGPNRSSCQTFAQIQDNLGHCQSPSQAAYISGVIMTEQNDPVEDVAISSTGFSNTTIMSQADGHYMIESLPQGLDYSIEPHRDDNYLNGVSTIDLVLISKHILGVQGLNSPYKMIAADVNNSKTITTLDVIMLRKLILGIIAGLPNNPSWRFVESSYIFPDPSDPWVEEFPELIVIDDLNGNLVNQNFVAVKIGDVNGSAHTTNLFGLDERSAHGSLVIMAEDHKVQAGKTYTVDFSSAAMLMIEGYQFTLNLDPGALELLEVHYGLAKEEHFGQGFIDQGKLTTSWNRNGSNTTSAGGAQMETLFGIEVRAEATGWLSDLISVSSDITPAEAYDQEGGDLGVVLDFRAGFNDYAPVAQSAELLQNQPNPFRSETQIGFNLPERAEASITIYDMSGRTLMSFKNVYDAGNNTVTIRGGDLPQSGIYYYTLETEGYTETRKMVFKE
jgi:hypothetical protein